MLCCSGAVYYPAKLNCRRSTTPVSRGNYLRKCLLSPQKFKRTLAPSGSEKAQNSELVSTPNGDNSHFRFGLTSVLYTQLDSEFNAYHDIRGAMNVKYFFMGFSVIVFAWVGTFALMMN